MPGAIETRKGLVAEAPVMLSGSDDAELRFLSVENTGGDSFAFAIDNAGSSPRLTHVSAHAENGTQKTTAIRNYLAAEPVLNDVQATTTSGGSFSRAITCSGINMPATTAVPVLRDVTASAAGGTTNVGIAFSTSCDAIITNSSFAATGGSDTMGLSIDGSSPPTLS